MKCPPTSGHEIRVSAGKTTRHGRAGVYSVRTGDKYPSIYEVCGLGYVDGLEGANCRHIRTAFVDGVMERTYTDEELAHIDDGHDVDFEGKALHSL